MHRDDYFEEKLAEGAYDPKYIDEEIDMSKSQYDLLMTRQDRYDKTLSLLHSLVASDVKLSNTTIKELLDSSFIGLFKEHNDEVCVGEKTRIIRSKTKNHNDGDTMLISEIDMKMIICKVI